MIGQRISHYEIVQEIGRGGMGVVYEARDMKLPRSVAIKFLPHEMRADERAKRRFVREAEAISALEHTNISTIHEIDETPEGDLFIVMPHYEGRTLEDMVKEAPLTIEGAVEIVTQAGSGLAKAHAKGIIHRDIKPANVFVTEDGVVKILDFGLAKLTGRAQLTKTGVSVGTVAYMSPEQITGGKVDNRTDIWSLGVVLYEALTQRLPFRGEIEATMMYTIVNEEMADITPHRSDVPEYVVNTITKALQKDLADRYEQIDDFLADLGEPSPAGGAPAPAEAVEKEQSIAVLPFDDISPDKDNEYFSDGLTEEVITDLSQIRALRVTSRNSAILFKGTEKDIRAIGSELDVRYVLRGSVRRAGNNLRISAQLVDVLSDSNLWAEKYSGTLDDVFDIQEKVSRSIVEALQVTLSPKEDKLVAQRPIDDARAYECYLRARQNAYSWSEDDLERALEYLQTALDIVGDNAMVYAGMAQVYFQYVNAGLRPADHLDVAEAHVERVLALDPESKHGHRLKGMIEISRRNFQEAVARLKLALEVDPNDADAMFWLVQAYMLAGKMEAADVLVERLLKVDPLTPLNRAGPGWVHFFEGRFAEALGPIRKVYESDPGNLAYRYLYVHMLAYNGRLEEAFELTDQLEADAPGHPLAGLCSLLKHALQGEAARVEETLTPELQAMARADPAHSWLVANCYALVKENDKAVDWLENAVDIGFINYTFLAEHERFLDSIRDDGRFQRLLARVKTEWEQFAE